MRRRDPATGRLLPNTIQDVLLQLVICEPTTLETGCWEWPGCRTVKGKYGVVRLGSRNQRVHKLVYEHFVGPVPEGLVLDHLCRNKVCANFEHLEPVTSQVNCQRGNPSTPYVTHCKNGHPWEEASTLWMVDSRGIYRRCAICRKAERDKNRIRRRK